MNFDQTTFISDLLRWKNQPYINVGPAFHWIQCYADGVWGYNEVKSNINFWSNLREDDVILFYSSTFSTSIIGFGVVSHRFIKNEEFWFLELKEEKNMWPNAVMFKRTYWLGEPNKIKIKTFTKEAPPTKDSEAIKFLNMNGILNATIQKGSNLALPVNSSACKMQQEILVDFLYEIFTESEFTFKHYSEKIDLSESEELQTDLEVIKIPEDKIDEMIKQVEDKSSTDVITSTTSKKKRNYKLYALLKKKFKYKCQSCDFQLLKFNSKYYIECCHITPHSNDGNTDTADNILVLCPNCHKRFDMGQSEDKVGIIRNVLKKFPHNGYKF